MKTGILLFFLLMITTVCSSQSYKTKEALKSVGNYEVDDNGNVTFMRIVELDSMKSAEIFNRAQEYFTYHYGSGESVLQVNDRETGRLLGKGLYTKTAVINGIPYIITDTWHILRIDVKDSKARLTLSLTEYSGTSEFDNSVNHFNDLVSSKYPINADSNWKNAFGQAFAESYKRANLTLDALEKTLKEGTTFKNADKDW